MQEAKNLQSKQKWLHTEYWHQISHKGTCQVFLTYAHHTKVLGSSIGQSQTKTNSHSMIAKPRWMWVRKNSTVSNSFWGQHYVYKKTYRTDIKREQNYKLISLNTQLKVINSAFVNRIQQCPHINVDTFIYIDI